MTSRPEPHTAPTTDQDAFVRELYQRYGSQLLAYAGKILVDPQHAEDVVQETMLRAWRHADRLTPEHGSVHHWLSRVARNIALDRIRARRARPSEVEPDSVTETGCDDHADAVLTSVMLNRALADLSPKQREAVEQVYLAGYTPTETAVRLGVPLGTVKTRLHHGLRRLRVRLATEAPAARTPRTICARPGRASATGPGAGSPTGPAGQDASRAG